MSDKSFLFFAGSKEWQMNFLLEAMKKDSVDTVIMLLEELDISPLHERLSLDRLSRLFSGRIGEGSWNLQLLVVFEDIGLMLIMSLHMIRDTFNFMVILLVVVMGYAVSSESLLYPVSATSAESLYHMPRKAYWQVFGELFLDEIENTGDAGCALLNSNQTDDNVMTLCTTMSFAGRHVVPVFLGVYIMITNVLLLNLLIARFNKTFENVLDSAEEHLSWQRCQSVQFYHSKFVPPPFNIITGAVCLVTKLWKTCRRSQEEHFVREDQRGNYK
nr:hypothetical protein BaRGS_001755 [Batillaria attramentaria]